MRVADRFLFRHQRAERLGAAGHVVADLEVGIVEAVLQRLVARRNGGAGNESESERGEANR